MEYERIVEGIFIQRPNRFIAIVEINGLQEIVHVKNTGRCKELLVSGAKVFCQSNDKATRKTKYSLISVYKGDNLVNVDSQVPNDVIEEALLAGKLPITNLVHYRREAVYGESRFDLYYETTDSKGYIEVKGVTLENEGLAQFPDAPTSRGSKHVEELIASSKEGYRSMLIFLIQLKGVHGFTPNSIMDSKFAALVEEATRNGVKILAFDALVTQTEICLDHPVPIFLEQHLLNP